MYISNRKRLKIVGERTRLYKARAGSESLKTSLPDGVRKTLKAKAEDEIEWTETTHQGKPAYTVTKVEDEN